MSTATGFTCAVLLTIKAATASYAGELPEDIWSGKHGGVPSITASVAEGISITLPAQAILDAGGGAISTIAEKFLNRWAADFCSGAFDFQSPHPGLTVAVALMKADNPDSLPGLATRLHVERYTISNYTSVTINYQPDHPVTCVAAAPPLS